MNLVVATAPAIEPLTLSETLLHLRVDIADDNSLVSGLISAAREYCEAAARRTFINTTFDLYLDAWPLYGQFELPNPPLVSVTGVYYTDENGDEAEFSSANYIVDSSSEPGRVRKKSTASWPTTTLQEIRGVRVRFVAGYGSTRSSVPEKYRQAMKLLIGHWYENRETVLAAQGYSVLEMPFAVKALLGIDRGGFF